MNRRQYRVFLSVVCRTCGEETAVAKAGIHGQVLLREVLDELRAEGWRVTTQPRYDRCPGCSAIASQQGGVPLS